MTHGSEIVFIGGYKNVSDASADYDSVAAAQGNGSTGRVEVAVVSRDTAGTLAIQRHARLGGIHVTHGPTDELKAATQEVERGAVALLVISAEDDAKAVDTATTRAAIRTSHVVEHFYLGNPDAGFNSGAPSDEVGGPPVGYDGGVPEAESGRPED
jgi:hypothetical protein